MTSKQYILVLLIHKTIDDLMFSYCTIYCIENENTAFDYVPSWRVVFFSVSFIEMTVVNVGKQTRGSIGYYGVTPGRRSHSVLKNSRTLTCAPGKCKQRRGNASNAVASPVNVVRSPGALCACSKQTPWESCPDKSAVGSPRGRRSSAVRSPTIYNCNNNLDG